MVTVDVTGKRFDRMSVARKSMIQLRSQSGHRMTVRTSPPSTQNGDDEIEVLMDEEGAAQIIDEATGEVQTVRRRSRTRKPRGRRRNTLAGTDQREIEEAAANGFVLQSIFLSVFLFAFVNPPCQSVSVCLLPDAWSTPIKDAVDSELNRDGLFDLQLLHIKDKRKARCEIQFHFRFHYHGVNIVHSGVTVCTLPCK